MEIYTNANSPTVKTFLNNARTISVFAVYIIIL